MTPEDSARTYQPPENGRAQTSARPNSNDKRSNSVLGALTRSVKSEADQDERTLEMGSQAPRSQSILGHRIVNKTVRWEGSSYGEGQVMESNGRISESSGGYT